MANRKSRSILINPKFQWTLIGYAAFIAILILVSVYGLFSFGFHEFSEIGAQAGLPADHVYFDFIRMQERTFLNVIGAMALVVALLLVVGGLIISHKIAGPIFRMQKELEALADENGQVGTPLVIRPIQFRKGDYFPELAQAFNRFVERYHEKQSKEKERSS